MPRRHIPIPDQDPRDDKIRALKDETCLLRHQILVMLPLEFSKLLHSFYHVETCEVDSIDALEMQWVSSVFDLLLKLAKLPDPGTYSGDLRIDCPLCSSSGSPYTEGYLVPGGLERHLKGIGKVLECPIMKAARVLAVDYFRHHFQDGIEAREEQNRLALTQRQATEPLFLVDPTQEPALADPYRGLRARDEESLMWAEARLRHLGFEIHRDGRVVSYTREYETVVVYADPRAAKTIEFKCFPRRKRRRNEASYERFTIPDNWRHDLPEKFERALTLVADIWATPEQLSSS